MKKNNKTSYYLYQYVLNILRKFKYNFLIKYFNYFDRYNVYHPKYSYAQCGEDLIISYLLGIFKIEKPFYIDIGAHHPTHISNTYLFYKNGATGICIEPDPSLFAKFERKRKRDICLNLGIGEANNEADFYIMSSKSLNTFSKTEAERYEKDCGHKIESTIKIPLVSINSILEKYCKQIPDFVSLDIEGLDFDVLQSFDFKEYRPKIFCVETLEYEGNKSDKKNHGIINFMINKGYFVYADTFINTIFVDCYAWEKNNFK